MLNLDTIHTFFQFYHARETLKLNIGDGLLDIAIYTLNKKVWFLALTTVNQHMHALSGLWQQAGCSLKMWKSNV